MTQHQLMAAFMAAPFIALSLTWLLGLLVVSRLDAKPAPVKTERRP